MNNIAEFVIIGRVGKIHAFESVTRVRIASNYRRQEESGEWKDDPYWNEIAIFNRKTRKFIEENVGVGDLIHARGTLRESRYQGQSAGEQFGVDLVAFDLAKLVTAATAGDD